MSGNAKRPERDHAEARSAIRDRRFDDAIGLLEQSLIGGPDDVDAAGGKIRRIDKKLAAFLGR